MPRIGSTASLREGRLKRLAGRIDALAEKDEVALRHLREIVSHRRAAAAELHAICGQFAGALNCLLERCAIELDPAAYCETSFREEGINLIQINARGRILQITFATTPELISTEEFRVPYTLAGSVRAFNQELLEKDVIEEQLIFFTIEGHRRMWRFFDARTYRSGPFDVEYLIALMEQLI
jgi:hypothetical protein